jgi:hypothetical protein
MDEGAGGSRSLPVGYVSGRRCNCLLQGPNPTVPNWLGCEGKEFSRHVRGDRLFAGVEKTAEHKQDHGAIDLRKQVHQEYWVASNQWVRAFGLLCILHATLGSAKRNKKV